MGQAQSIPGKDGIDGRDGKDGKDGKDGVGIQGPVGNLSDPVSVKQTIQPLTMWCADGDLCKVPAGKKGLEFGVGETKILMDNGTFNIQSTQNVNLKNNTFTENGINIPGNNFIHFGSNVANKENNAGKIGYKTFDTNALDIVGAGEANKARVVRVWDTLKLGTSHIIENGDYIRVLSDPNDTSKFDKGFAAKNLWAKDKIMAQDGNMDIVAEIEALKLKTKHWNTDGNYVGYGVYTPAIFGSVYEKSQNAVQYGDNIGIESVRRYGKEPSRLSAYGGVKWMDNWEPDNWSKLKLVKL